MIRFLGAAANSFLGSSITIASGAALATDATSVIVAIIGSIGVVVGALVTVNKSNKRHRRLSQEYSNYDESLKIDYIEYLKRDNARLERELRRARGRHKDVSSE
jgi:hypothetical protein